jgi:acyl-CoA synthetase (NDP forming)
VSAAAAVVAAALGENRRELNEAEAYVVAAALGIGVPRHVVVPPGGPVPALGDLTGDRVVVKVLAPAVAHKTDRGGVQMVSREAGAVESAIAAMAPAFAGEEVAGWLVAEFVAHAAAPGSEVLLGVRRTAEFGPVVVLGIGGIHAELLAPALPPVVLRTGGEADPAGALARSPAVGLLTGGTRGGPPGVAARDLEAFLTRLLTAVPGLPPELVEFEANPVVFTGGGPVALDALGRLGAVPDAFPPRPPGQIDRLLHPRSLAIVGVSDHANPGRVILENSLAAGFPADSVTVVKPEASEIAGCRCVPDLAGLPGRVDLLILSIRAAAAPEVLEEVVQRGAAEAVILIPGGLGEREGSEALAGRARSAVEDGRRRGDGPVVNGGNSMGIRSVPGRYDATFIPGYKASVAPDAQAVPLAVVSQSGAFAIARLDRFPHLRPRYLVTLGNQLDLTVGDYLAFWQDDPTVEVCAVYLEGFRPGDGGRFLDSAVRIRRRGGVVILYLGGRTPAGAAAASSHTASLAPDHRVARALAAEAGVLVAESLEDFEDLLRVAVLLRGREITGRRLGAVSNAGFECVALADDRGPFIFPPLGAGSVGRIEAVLAGLRLEGLVRAQNPLDLTPMTGAAGFAAAAAAVLADPAVEVGVVGCVPLTPALATLEAGEGHAEDLGAGGSLARRLVDLWRGTAKAWVVVVDGGRLYDPLAGYLEREGLAVFRAADRALRALGRYAALRLGG